MKEDSNYKQIIPFSKYSVIFTSSLLVSHVYLRDLFLLLIIHNLKFFSMKRKNVKCECITGNYKLSKVIKIEHINYI